MPQNRTKLYGGLVWILSGCALLTYGILGLTQTDMPGAEQLVALVQQADGTYLYLAAFVTILLEGLYFIGSFFPGSSLIILLAILAQTADNGQFLLLILTIFIGWTLAGALNIFGATYFSHLLQIQTTTNKTLRQDAELTWFPAFRSNTEVAQIAEGHSKRSVFLGSTIIKLYASAGVAVYALVLPFIIDIQELSNEEGFWGLGIIALVNFTIGGKKIYDALHKDPIEPINPQ